jgi:hypothetical protein
MTAITSHIRNRKLAVSLGLLVIIGAVVIDLVFSGNPALSVGILFVFVIIGVVRHRSTLGRLRPRGSDQQR